MMFKVGDLVRLKSGGPVMTVNGAKGTLLICAWFVKLERKAAQFVPETLEAASVADGKK